ncbi:MAG: YidC/Oxa1 family membrane protein insertase [Clostridia bacterium]|nr:YidC/Oxa1 family membrane protein insertase [Clostridia bacterium]
MPQTKTSAHRALKLLCALLTLTCLIGMFGVVASATVETVDGAASDTVPVPDTTEGETAAAPSLTESKLEALAEIISAATADSKAEDTRTPRDKLTAAYFAGDIEAARAAVEQANAAADKKVRVEDVDYSAINMADVEELIEEMKTDISLDKPTGFFEVIKLAAGSILSWLTMIVGGNYVIGLLLFAIILELITLPIAIKQQKNSIKQASLQPKERAIRKKYAGREDQATKQKMSTEIQEMYQREGFNPASGCLPMILQLAVVMILYQVVIDPIVYVMKMSNELSTALYTFVNTSEAAGGLGLAVNSSRGTIEIASLIKEYGAEFFTKLKDFVYFSNGTEIVEALEGSTFPNFNLFGLNLGLVPSIKEFSWLLLIPVLTFVVYFGSMKITRKLTYQPQTTDQATGCSNNVMDITMPLFSVYICFVVPAALGVYWMFKSILGTVSKIIMTKVMPVPTFTEEEYKAAEKEILKGKPAPAPRTGSSGKAVRSLHHIDDEDFEDTREAALARKARLEAQEAEEAAKKEAENKRLADSTLIKKEDDRPQLSLKELKKKAKEAKQKQAAEKKAAENAPADKAEDATVSEDKKDAGQSDSADNTDNK